MEITTIDLYSDGACSGNPGPGGWGSILIYKDIKKEISGYNKHTTNNRMEITAIIEGLKCLKKPCKVNVYTDSSYVCNTFNNHWIDNWKNNGWKTSNKKNVENKDLWIILLDLMNIHELVFHKVKGHADNDLNNRCDEMATGEIAKNR